MACIGLGDRDKLIEDLLDSSTNLTPILAMGLNDFGRTPHGFNDSICLIVLKMKGLILPYKDFS
jgi:hypothetical protein